ncbi:hypothetical protein [Streptomyces hypolithicus]
MPQTPMPQQPPGPPTPQGGQAPGGYGAPQPFPGPGQFPMQPGPGYPVQAPYGPQPRSGNPVGAFFLGFLVSFIVALIYSVVMYATYKDQSADTARVLYVLHALLNGAAVGAVVGLVARRSVGAHISGAIVAMLGTFFGFTNGVVLITADAGGHFALRDMMEVDPFYPAKVWWGGASGTEMHTLLGLLAAVAAAWGLAFVVSRSRR